MRHGDDAAVILTGLFEGHYDRLVAHLSVAAGSREVASDAVQEAFVQAHLKWRRLAGYDDPVGWIRRVAVNRVLNHHRGVRRHLRAITRLREAGVESDSSAPIVDRVDVELALAQLSLRQRMAVSLHYLEGLPVERTAAAMGVSPGTIKTHLSRAREAMRALLEVSG